MLANTGLQMPEPANTAPLPGRLDRPGAHKTMPVSQPKPTGAHRRTSVSVVWTQGRLAGRGVWFGATDPDRRPDILAALIRAARARIADADPAYPMALQIITREH